MKPGSSVLPSFLPDGLDWHLLLHGASGPGIDTLLYLPATDTPGLCPDLFRIDRLPESPLPLDGVVRQWLARYQQLARGTPLHHRVEGRDGSQRVVVAGFDHPVRGTHDTCLRYLRAGGHDLSFQLIRKSGGWDHGELRPRLDALAGVSPELVEGPRPASPFAAEAREVAGRVRSVMMEAAAAGKVELRPDEVRSLLERASPLHSGLEWAHLARWWAHDVLEQGRIDELAGALAMREQAMVLLWDLPPSPRTDAILFDLASEIADVSLLIHGEDRGTRLGRAATLHGAVARHRRSRGEEGAFRSRVLAALAERLLDPGGEEAVPWMHGATDEEEPPDGEDVLEGVEALFAWGDRTAFLARQGDRTLARDAWVADDLAQFLLEDAALRDALPKEELHAHLARAFQRQVAAQRLYRGLDEGELEDHARDFARRYREGRPEPPTLLYLRPLRSTRRGRLPNRFGEEHRELFQLLDRIPEDLTWESALHVGLMTRFHTTALGGPADLFGMERLTAMGKNGASAGLHAWQQAVKPSIASAAVILLLLGETDGLRWELEEIARQDRRHRLVLFTPEKATDPETGLHPSHRVQALGALGYRLEEDAPATGFLMMERDGRMRRHLPLDALWSGELATELERRAGDQAG